MVGRADVMPLLLPPVAAVAVPAAAAACLMIPFPPPLRGQRSGPTGVPRVMVVLAAAEPEPDEDAQAEPDESYEGRVPLLFDVVDCIGIYVFTCVEQVR